MATARKTTKKKAAPRKRAPAKSKAKSRPKARKPVTERSKKSQPITGLDGPVTRRGQLHFSPKDLLLFKLSEAELANAHQAVALKRNEQARAESAHKAQMHRLEAEVQGLLRGGQFKHAEHVTLKEKIAAVYGVDFDHLTYDDQSGRIHIHEQPVK